MNNLIYIAGPITNGGTAGPKETFDNIRRAMLIYGVLIDKGYAPILPHFSYFYWLHSDEPRMSHSDWLKLDFNYVRECDYFYYMEPAYYGQAKGARAELKLAEKIHKVIFNHEHVEDVPKYPFTPKSLRMAEA